MSAGPGSDHESSDVVRVDVRGRIAVITLNRPEARNAINRELAEALGSTLARFEDDESLRVAVLRGEGPAFCAGQDLKAFAAGEPIGLPEHPEWGFGGLVRHRIGKPLIAAVHGYAFGGGLELALACDLLVLGRSVRLALPEVTLGLFAAAGGVPRIAQQLPVKIATELALTGRMFSAAVAERWGLANAVVDDSEVLDRALALALEIAENAPHAVRATKRLLRASTASSTWQDEYWEVVDEEIDNVFGSAEAREGVSAFLEKRAPSWR